MAKHDMEWITVFFVGNKGETGDLIVSIDREWQK